MKWKIQIHGTAGSQSFEISVVNDRIFDAQTAFGWFDENKLLITHNGGPCRWPLTQKVWDKQILLAKQVAKELNEGN